MRSVSLKVSPDLLYVFPEPLPLPRARGIQVAHTISELARKGLRVTLAYVPGDGDPFLSCGLERPDGLNLTPLSRSLPAPFSRIRSNRIFFFRLRHMLASLKHGTPVMVRHIKMAAMLIRAYPQFPLLYEAHEVFADTASPKARARVERDERAVMAGAAAVVCNSKATAERLTEKYPAIRGPLVVIPNGVQLPARLPERNWEMASRNLIYTGSFFGWKGVSDLIEAAAGLPDFNIRLIGGNAEQRGRLLADAPPPLATLSFEDRLPHHEVMQALLASCVAVLPNRPDPDSQFTSPIKLFEYMGAGCAIVASDLPSIREIVGDDDVAWFESGNSDSLVKAIRQLTADPERMRQMSQRVRQKAERYTWAVRAERLASLIGEIRQ
jgi:glycosyltransferase involved in cell wall biosynthesis